MSLREARTIDVSIACSYDAAYAFLREPANFAKWASGLGSSLTRARDGTWVALTAEGAVRVRFTEPNAFGVLDHFVQPPGESPEIDVPMRLIRNGAGCTLSLTLFRQAGMTDDRFAADADWVRRDLQTLKVLLDPITPD